MGKVFRVLAVVAAVAVAVFAPQISAAILGALAISSAVATALLATALTIGAGLAIRALGGAPTPSSNIGPPQVFRQSISNSYIVYGERRAGGLMAFFHAAQVGDDHFRYFVIAHAGHHCDSLVSWMLNDDLVTVDGSGMVTSGPYANACWLFFQEGNASETANATFVSECGGNWTTDHKGNGVCATYAKFEMTDDVVQAGMPTITAIIKGKDDISDPRGPSTGYTDNATLVTYDWLALPREEGGFGAYADEIPDDDWISAQANVCDETVNSEARYTINAVIQTGAPPGELRDLMTLSQAGSYAYSGGKHFVRPGYWVAPSETFGEDDFSGPLQVSPFLAGDVVANEVQGTYVSPDDNYLGMPFATQTTSPAPSDVRQLDIDLPFTTSKHQAERIASIQLKRAQCEKTVVAPLNIEGLRAKALDTVIINTIRYGLSNYAFQVATWGLSADWNVILGLREENEDIYDAPTPVAAPTVPSVVVPDPIGGPVDEAAIIDAVGALFTDTATTDVTYTPGTSITVDVKDDGITFGKMQNIATDRLIGRDTASSGDPEEISVGNGLEFTGAGGIGIANDGVTNARLANMNEARIKGRAAAAGTGDPTDLTPQEVRVALRGGAMVRKAADQTGADYTSATIVAWDQEVYDEGGFHDNVTNNSRLLVPSGITRVRVGCHISVTAATAANSMLVRILKSGTGAYDGAVSDRTYLTGTSGSVTLSSGPMTVAAGEYFQVELTLPGDTAITLQATTNNFWIEPC